MKPSHPEDAPPLVDISHQHWDHTGGIYSVLNANRDLRVLVPRSFSPHFKADMKRYGVHVMESAR